MEHGIQAATNIEYWQSDERLHELYQRKAALLDAAMCGAAVDSELIYTQRKIRQIETAQYVDEITRKLQPFRTETGY